MMVFKWWFFNSIVFFISLFWCCPWFGQWEPLSWSVTFWIALVILTIFYFLPQQDVLGPSQTFPARALEWVIFFQGSLVALTREWHLSQDLDSGCPHCCCVSLLLGPLSRHLGNIYIWYMNMCVCVYTTDSNPTLQNLF